MKKTTFGKRLQELRAEDEISLRGLAEEVDLSFNVLGMIERGEATPSMELIGKLKGFFRLSHSEEKELIKFRQAKKYADLIEKSQQENAGTVIEAMTLAANNLGLGPELTSTSATMSRLFREDDE